MRGTKKNRLVINGYATTTADEVFDFLRLFVRHKFGEKHAEFLGRIREAHKGCEFVRMELDASHSDAENSDFTLMVGDLGTLYVRTVYGRENWECRVVSMGSTFHDQYGSIRCIELRLPRGSY